MRAWWENKGTSVEISKKTQKRIAIICSIVLAGVLLAVAARAMHPVVTDWLDQRQQPTTGEKPADEAPATNDQPNDDQANKDTNMDTPNDQDNQPTAPSSDSAKTPTAAYSYTAAAGDSYTVFARDAIRQYVTQQNTAINAVQALDAEVSLANAAGSPLLEIGDVVTIAQADVATVLGTKADTATSDNKDDNAYGATAVAGDNYTTLARTAVQTYAANHNLTLTSAQRVAAETQLAAAAGFPQVDVGQQIQFDTAALKNTIEAVRSLSAEQQAVWQVYVAGVAL